MGQTFEKNLHIAAYFLTPTFFIKIIKKHLISCKVYFILLHCIVKIQLRQQKKYTYIEIERKVLIGHKLFEMQKNFNLVVWRGSAPCL
ncbi:hypothetical protein Ahy_A10g048359 isoform A [Arachis hypogaea]|uniref:Uncharacterized protein n=1 Tax=Arachis hypogaea TaxID=3818 RepID=A0A445B4X4_ARAHY|nr:hypothetical protein Ahy_A10g048359 isoform A [Arachis hypogaea]